MPGRNSDKKDASRESVLKGQRSDNTHEVPDWSRFPVVGIGASAGGLEALEEFFGATKPDMNAAFVVITHLDPNRASMMAEILAKFTSMEVMEAVHEIPVEPNKVYVLPPGKTMSIYHGRLMLAKRSSSNEPLRPIDVFLRSLAEDQTENAIAIILSGNGSDGSMGLRSVQANLGIVLVQDPETAKYPSMPQSAIGTGLADFILPSNEMPEQILHYYERLQEKRQKVHVGEADSRANLAKILTTVKKLTGHDFSHYKKNTICRRIERRMSVHELRSLADYSRLLEGNKKEAQLLFKEFLIQVTKFYRDPEAFESLKNWLKKLLLSKNQYEETVRIWVPGCSTGEEAYSIAIIVKELLDELSLDITVQIFGTDIDEDAIIKARTGEYPISILEDVGERRANTYFVKDDDILRIRKDIREMVVFASQDLTHDPPFVRLDLISCRNLLIYFEMELQKRVLDIFAYALNSRGILFLGTSESVDNRTDEFIALDSKNKVFQRKSTYSAPRLKAETPIPQMRAAVLPPTEPTAPKVPNITAVAEHEIVGHYSPPAVIIDEDDNIIYFHGRTGKFLEPASGRANLNIQSMLHEDIQVSVLAAIKEGRESGREVVKHAVRVTINGDSCFLNVIVRSIAELKSKGGMLIIFQEVTIPSSILKTHSELEIMPDSRAKIAELEEQLKYSKENLQSTIEELETSNEELKSTNEELQSTNEELQSIAEESETTKEELNSLNEELLSVNSELETKNRELLSMNGDMRNLLNSVEVATVFLDNNLNIKRFTPQISKIMNLLPSDIGRPISDISTYLRDGDLDDKARNVLEDLNSTTQEVQTNDGRWYLIRIIPYRTLDSRIDGVVITFIDIDSQKRAQKELVTLSSELKGNLQFIEAIVNTIGQPILVLDKDLNVMMANHAFSDAFQVNWADTKDKKIYELGNEQWNIPRLRELLENILPKNQEMNDFIVEADFPTIGHRVMSLSAKRLELKELPGVERIILAIDDVTETT